MLKLKRYEVVAALAIVLITSALVLQSCNKDFLNRQPLGQYTSDNYPYPVGGGPYDQFVYAAYSSLRDYKVTDYAFISAVSIRSDDADKGSSLFDGVSYGLGGADNFPVAVNAQFVNELWTAYYGDLIYKCNYVLQQVAKDTTATPEATKTLARAEARFLRGYAYFTLERLFGNIPIIDSVLDIQNSVVPQSDPATVYTFIEQDLQYAAANLPLTWDPKFLGRATSGAANGLLAKVYLYEKKWDQAMQTAAIVINSTVYNLNTSYQDIWKNSGENCSESIFEVQCYADANHQTDYGCQYAEVQGVRGVGPQDFGWGFNNPSHQLHLAYEPGDPRINSTILFVPTPAPTIFGETFGRPEPNDSMYNMKVYLGNDPGIRSKVGGLVGQHAWWEDVRILRYADVVLMYAEAANESGQTNEALEKLEWVRARARNGNAAILPKVTTTDKAQLRSAIQHERRIELAMEHERFFDIVRWGIAADVLHAAGKVNFQTGRDELLPIPQVQIDLSKGVLHQNPGY
ncbi:MAG: RagB/SusD family nutrient uptake outer membrane protein [Parafilimonas sp.]|nr:RagB/SusD family nutrient uptake outer membrane protein [Parafilimonas sp.]